MYKKSLVAVTAALVTLAGCAPAGRVADTAPVTADEVKADQYGTSPEFEQDLRECLEAHPIPADHAPNHPAAAPLAECVAKVYETHAGGAIPGVDYAEAARQLSEGLGMRAEK